MIRIATLVTALLAAAPAAAQLAALDQIDRPALKRAAIVTSEIVRIGDLIENAGAVADVAIFRAPDLGQTGSLPAATVMDAVRPHHIHSLDTRGVGEITVTRASRTVTAKDFEALVLRALAGQQSLGEPKNLAVAFDHAVRALHVEPGAGEFTVVRSSFDGQTRRFDVTFELPGSAVARRLPLRFIGQVSETVEAAITLRPLGQNETIRASDVMVERRPKSEFASGAAASLEDVLGFAAKRPLRQGQAIRASDLMKPELIGRNDTVLMQFEVPGMLLTIRGKAMEAGALGDVINVLNPESKRTVQATVTGTGRVTVTSSAARVATVSQARKQTQ
jgi:flagella basal body P-ring formation protein FlgA